MTKQVSNNIVASRTHAEKRSALPSPNFNIIILNQAKCCYCMINNRCNAF